MAPTRSIGATQTPTLGQGSSFRPIESTAGRTGGESVWTHSGRLLAVLCALAVPLGLLLGAAANARWGGLAGMVVLVAALVAAGAAGYSVVIRRKSALRAKAVREALVCARTTALQIAQATLSARDAETANHSEEVAQLCDALCEEFEIQGDERQRILLAAGLHDVGKVAISPEILKKPGPLDQTEWDVVKQHTLVGERILRSVPELDEAASLVRHSHEHWDGSGYPDGLAGEEIPLGSRVVLCADAFHAIRCDRPYRKGRSASEAIAELRANAGTQFDPTVVETLEEVASSLRGRAAARIPVSRRTIALLVGGVLALLGTAFATGILPLPKPIADTPPAVRLSPPMGQLSSGAGRPQAKAASAARDSRGEGAARRRAERRRSAKQARPAKLGRESHPAGAGPDFPTPVRAHGDPTQANGVARGRPATVVPHGRGR